MTEVRIVTDPEMI